MMWPGRLTRPRFLVVALHLPFVAFVAVVGATGFGDGEGFSWSAIPLAAIAGAIQKYTFRTWAGV